MKHKQEKTPVHESGYNNPSRYVLFQKSKKIKFVTLIFIVSIIISVFVFFLLPGKFFINCETVNQKTRKLLDSNKAEEALDVISEGAYKCQPDIRDKDFKKLSFKDKSQVFTSYALLAETQVKLKNTSQAKVTAKKTLEYNKQFNYDERQKVKDHTKLLHNMILIIDLGEL